MKQGILHDYDLHANHEPSAHDRVCVTCGANPCTYQWSDYSGEGMCTRCGTPYQLKWGGEQREKEGKYPYLNLRENLVPLLREYYEETRQFTYLGSMLGGDPPGLREFDAWMKGRHPEWIAARRAEREAADASKAPVGDTP